MNRDIVQLREVVIKLTQMLAGMGLRVTQVGTRAYVETDPTTLKPLRVNIPMIPDNADDEFIMALQGFIDHEVAHILFTDWKWFKTAIIEGGEELRSLLNIAEDPRIEREVGMKWPGSKFNIDKLHRYFIERITEEALRKLKAPPKRGQPSLDTPMNQFNVLIVPIVRAWSGQHVFQEWLDKNNYWDLPLVKELVKGLNKIDPKIIPGIADMRSTEDAMKLARHLKAVMHPPPRKAPPMPKSEEDAPPPPPPETFERMESDEPQEGEDGETDSKEKKDKKSKPEKGKKDKSEKDKDDGADGDGEDNDDADGEEGAGDSDSDDEGDGSHSDADEDADSESGSKSKKSKKSKGKKDKKKDKSDDADESEDEGSGEGDEEADGSGDGEDQSDDEGDASGSGDEGEGDEDDETSGGASGDDAEDEGDDEGSGDGGSDDEEDEGSRALTKDKSEPKDGRSKDKPKDGEKREYAPGEKGLDDPSIFETIPPGEIDPIDFEEALTEHVSDLVQEISKDADYLIYTRDNDEIKTYELRSHYKPEFLVALDDRVGHMIHTMQKDIERMMAQRARVVNVPGYRSGRLHSSGLSRLFAGDDKVFRRKTDAYSKDTAVTLLMDNSGSMHGNKMITAMAAGYALAQTLERCGIANECLGFTTSGGGWVKPEDLRREEMKLKRSYSRWEAVIMPIYKSFDEKFNPGVRSRFACASAIQDFLQSNIDGESVEYAAMRLMKRKEKRKVLIVLSDGQPACSGNSSEVARHLKDTITALNRRGIETVGIGIESEAVRHYYPKHIVMKNVKDLPGIVMNELKRILFASAG